ncbi:MAG: reverse transcriptase domain-containing protein [Planctomycetota bacterium]
MKTQLEASDEEIEQKIVHLINRADVADLLEIPDKFLCAILYGVRERKNYSTFEIQKKSKKTRIINKPPKNIAILQSKLHHALSLIYNPKRCVHGFARKRSVVSNAQNHCRRRHLLNIDLRDFFPSIHIGRVRGVFMRGPYNMGEQAAEVVAQICCLDNGELPQGGITSPIISNLVCRRLDSQLTELAKEAKCQYSRYADDITFSTFQTVFPQRIARINEGEAILGDELIAIVQNNVFEVNPEKVKYVQRDLRQEVTGITVNEFPNVKRQFILSISSGLYSWSKFGYKRSNKDYAQKLGIDDSCVNLSNVLKGRIAYLKMVKGENSPLFRKMAFKFNSLSESKIGVRELEKIEPYPLRGGYPKSQMWNFWFERYRELIAFLEIKNDRGDLRTGTAYDIGNNLLATAGHNLDFPINKIWLGDSEVKHETVDNHIYKSRKVDVGLIKLREGQRKLNTWIPTQSRLPEIGEEVAAIGYPVLPQRDATLVMHMGIVESLPINQSKDRRFIQVSFQSGGGLSGSPLVDRKGFVVGIMIENIFQSAEAYVPGRPFGQAVPIEYLYRYVNKN